MISRVGFVWNPLYRNVLFGLRNKNVAQLRNSHVASYRSAPPPHSKATMVCAELVGAAMWWWVLWHLWHEPEHITGEFPYPDTSEWTNAELGIPS